MLGLTTRGTVIRPRADHRTAPGFGQYSGALAAQLFHTRTDRHEIIGSSGTGHVSPVS
jgi:hypothetical protein